MKLSSIIALAACVPFAACWLNSKKPSTQGAIQPPSEFRDALHGKATDNTTHPTTFDSSAGQATDDLGGAGATHLEHVVDDWDPEDMRAKIEVYKEGLVAFRLIEAAAVTIGGYNLCLNATLNTAILIEETLHLINLRATVNTATFTEESVSGIEMSANAAKRLASR